MSDLKLSVETDTSPVQQDLDHLNKKIDSLGASADRMGGKVAAAGGRMSGNIKDSTAAANKLDSALSSVASTAATAAAAIAATGGAYAITHAADEATNLRNKLALVANEQTSLLALQDETYQLSKDTRSSLKETVGLYYAINQAMKDGYDGQARAATITSSINKSIQLSGASAESASAAITQLAQGLGSGVLRGEELNSVIEQTPRLARAIAAGLGVSVSALRGLGEAGALTTASVIDAIASQTQTLDREFAKTTATVAQGGARIAESMKQSVGEVDRLTGASASLSDAMSGVAGRIDGSANAIESRTAKIMHSVRMALVDIRTLAHEDFGVTDAFKYAKNLLSNTASATREVGEAVTQMRMEEGYDFMDSGFHKVEGRARTLGYQLFRLQTRFAELRVITASLKSSWESSQLRPLVESAVQFADVGGRIERVKASIERLQTTAGIRDMADPLLRVANSVGFIAEAAWRVLPKVDFAYAKLSDHFAIFSGESDREIRRFVYRMKNSWELLSRTAVRATAGDGIWAGMVRDAHYAEMAFETTNMDMVRSWFNRMNGWTRQTGLYQFAEAIGLVKHKLIEFDGLNLAGMRNELRRLRNDMQRTFAYNVTYPFARLSRHLRYSARLAYSAFYEGWNDTFNASTGDAFGGAIHRMLKAALVGVGTWVAAKGSAFLAHTAKGTLSWAWLFGDGITAQTLSRLTQDIPVMMANLYAFVLRAARAAVHGEETWLDVMLRPYKRIGKALYLNISKSLGLHNPLAPVLAMFTAAGTLIDNLITKMVGGKFNRMMLKLLPRGMLVRHLTGSQKLFTSLSGLSLGGVSFDKVGDGLASAFTTTMVLADKAASAIKRVDVRKLERQLISLRSVAKEAWQDVSYGAELMWGAVRPMLIALAVAMSAASRSIRQSASGGWLRELGRGTERMLRYLAGLDYVAMFDSAKSAVLEVATWIREMRDEVAVAAASALTLFQKMVDGVGTYATRLRQAYAVVRQFVEDVIAGFYRVWDEIVGHCYWPDMVNGVIAWAHTMLQVAGGVVDRFTTGVIDSFRKLPGAVEQFMKAFHAGEITWSSVGHSIGAALGRAVAAAGVGLKALQVEVGVRWENASAGMKRLTEWLSREVSFALFTGLVLFAGGGAPVVLALLTHGIFTAVINPLEKGLSGVLGPSGVLGELGNTLGRGAAVFVQTLWHSALDYVSMLHRVIPEFVRGFLDEMGVAGSVFNTILHTVFLSLDNPLVAILFGAAAIAAYRNGFKGLAEVWKQSMASVRVVRNAGEVVALSASPRYAGLETMGRQGQRLKDLHEAFERQSAAADAARSKMIDAAAVYEKARDAEAALAKANAARLAGMQAGPLKDSAMKLEAQRQRNAAAHIDTLQQELRLAREVSKTESAAASKLRDETDKHAKTILPQGKGGTDPVEFSPFMLVAGLLTLNGALETFRSSTEEGVDRILGAFAGLATGIPLLLASVMGPEGAVRLIADGAARIRNALSSAMVPSAARQNQFLSGLKDAGMGALHIFTETTEAASKVLRNFLDNRRDYAMGNISLKEMLLGKDDAQKVNLGETLSGAWKSIKDGATDMAAWVASTWAGLGPRFSAAGAVLGQAWQKGASGAAAAGASMKAELVSIGLAMTAYWANLKAAMVGLVAKFGQSGILSSLIYGRAGRNAMIAGLLVVLSLLSTTANAASNVHDALKEARGSGVGADYSLADGVMDLGSALLVGVPFFTALPHLLRGDIKGAFVSVVEVVKDLGRNMKSLGLGTVSLARDMGGFAARTAETLLDAYGAFAYGHGVKREKPALPELPAPEAKYKKPSGLLGVPLADTVNAWNFARMARRSDDPADREINPWFAARSQRQWDSYKPIRDVPPSTITTTGRIKENVRATIDTVTSGLSFMTSGITNMVASLTGLSTVLAGIAVIASVFAVGGVLAVYMFGEGDGFFQKLENVKDKLHAMVTGIPTVDVLDPRAKPLVKSLRAEQQEPIAQYGFVDKLQSLDYNQLSTSAYSELQRRVDAVTASLQSLSSAQYDNVEASAAAGAAVASSADSLDRFLAKQARAKFNSGAAEERQSNLLKMIEGDSTSSLEKLGNMEWLSAALPSIRKFGSELSSEMKMRANAQSESWRILTTVPESALRNIREALGDSAEAPAGLAESLYSERKVGTREFNVEVGSSATLQTMQREYDRYAMMFSSIDALRSTMSSADQGSVDKSVSEFHRAYADLRSLEKLGPFKDTDEWAKLNAEFLRTKANLDAVGAKFINLGEAQKQNAEYMQQMKAQWSTWDKVKDATGFSSADDQEKMAQAGNFMDQSQMNILGAVQAEKDRLLNQLLGKDNAMPITIDMAPRIRINHEQEKAKLKALTEEFNTTLVISASIEWTTKNSGLELDQDSVLRFYAENKDAYEQWRESVSALTKAERELKNAQKTDDGNTTKLRELISIRDKARETMQALAPKLSPMENFQKLGQQWQMPTLDVAQLANAPGTLSAVSNSLEELNRKKVDLDRQWAARSVDVDQYIQRMKRLEDEAAGVRKQLEKLKTPLAQFQGLASGLSMPSIDAQLYADNIDVMSRIGKQMEQLDAEKKKLDTAWEQGQMELTEYAAKLGLIERAAAGVRGELNRVGKTANDLALDALSEFGANQSSLFKMGEDNRDKAVMRAQGVKDLKLTATTSTNKEERDAAAKRWLAEQKALNKQFEVINTEAGPGKDLFERFSEYAQRGGLSGSLDQIAGLGAKAQQAIAGTMHAAAQLYSRMRASKGPNGLPSDTEGFRSMFLQWREKQQEFEDALANGAMTLSDAWAKAFDGADAKTVYATLAAGSRKRLAELGAEIDLTEKQISRFTAANVSEVDSRMLAALDRIRALKDEAGRLMSVLPTNQKLFEAASSRFGVSFDEERQAGFNLADLTAARGLMTQIAEQQRRMDNPDTELQDWQAALRTKIGLTKELNSLGKVGLQRELERVGLGDIDASMAERSLTIRERMSERLAVLKDEYAEYLSLRDKVATGEASTDDTTRFNQLATRRDTFKNTNQSMMDLNTMSGLLQSMKLEMGDLKYMSGVSLQDLQANRLELVDLYAQLGTLGTDQTYQAELVNREIARRLKMEENITGSIQERKRLEESFKSNFADGLKGVFNGTANLGSITLNIANTAVDSMLTRMSSTFFSGLSSKLAEVTGAGVNTTSATMGTGATLGAWMAGNSEIGARNGAVLGLAATPLVERALPVVTEAFQTGGALGSVGDMFRTGGALESVGSFVSSLFGGDSLGELGSSLANPMWVRLVSNPFDGLGGLEDGKGVSDLLGGTEDLAGGIGDDISAAIDSLGSGLSDTLGGLGQSLSGMLGGLFSGFGGGSSGGDLGGLAMAAASAFGLPAFDTGGIVGGRIGAPQLALVHSGETILPTHKQSLGSILGGGGGAGGAGNTTILQLSVTGDISRQTRKEVLGLIPSITAGVNSTNKETNYRR